jgi:uncharacterized protein (TIGR03083 family)
MTTTICRVAEGRLKAGCQPRHGRLGLVADTGEVYVEAQQRLLGLIESSGDAGLTRPVPACPDWRVRDVVAHVAGLAIDVIDGGLPADFDLLEQWRDPAVAALRDDMTARQVETRRPRELDDVVAEWRTRTPDLLAVLRGERQAAQTLPFGMDAILVTDLTVHEQDIRGALGAPGGRDAAGVGVGLAAYGFGVGHRLTALGLPALEVRYDAKSRTFGPGEPAASVSAEKFELFRAFAGRRSRKQIEGYDWTGDPEPYLALIPAYGERSDALDE